MVFGVQMAILACLQIFEKVVASIHQVIPGDICDLEIETFLLHLQYFQRSGLMFSGAIGVTSSSVFSAKPLGFRDPPFRMILMRFSFASSRVCVMPSNALGVYPGCFPSRYAMALLARLTSVGYALVQKLYRIFYTNK